MNRECMSHNAIICRENLFERRRKISLKRRKGVDYEGSRNNDAEHDILSA